MSEKQFERVLIPYFGENLPEKAESKAFEKLEEDGELYLLHIVDEGPTRSFRYRAGQMGDDSEMVKAFKKAMKDIQEEDAKNYVDGVVTKAAQKGVSVIALFSSGSPGEETVKVAKEYEIQLVILEHVRDKLTEIFAGDEIDYISKNASCKVEVID